MAAPAQGLQHSLSCQPGKSGEWGGAAWLTAAVCAAGAGAAPASAKIPAPKGHLSVLYGAAHSPGRRDYMQARASCLSTLKLRASVFVHAPVTRAESPLL